MSVVSLFLHPPLTVQLEIIWVHSQPWQLVGEFMWCCSVRPCMLLWVSLQELPAHKKGQPSLHSITLHQPGYPALPPWGQHLKLPWPLWWQWGWCCSIQYMMLLCVFTKDSTCTVFPLQNSLFQLSHFQSSASMNPSCCVSFISSTASFPQHPWVSMYSFILFIFLCLHGDSSPRIHPLRQQLLGLRGGQWWGAAVSVF